jgi:acyl-CoA synthetase (AMP-forming)/AMP-acid ligase II
MHRREIRHRLPSEQQAELYIRSCVTADNTAAGSAPPPTIAAVRHLLDEAAVPQGHAVLITAADAQTQLVAFLACYYAGVVPVLLPRGCPAQRIHLVARALGARAVLEGVRATGAPGTSPAVVRHLPAVRPVPYSPGHAILMTSGTSGAASACLHHMASLFLNAQRHAQAIGLSADDSVLLTMPLHYSFALVAQALAGLVTGAQLVLGGPPFSTAGYARSLSEHDITVSSLSPTLVRTVLQDDRPFPLTLRAITVGGDALETAHVREMLKRRPHGELYLTYGLTEAGPRVSTLAAHQEPPTRYTSVGRPLPGVSVSLDRPSPAGIGELLVTTDTAMVSRVGDTDVTRRVLVGTRTLATGDGFRTDDDGYLYFCGRLSDFVVINGDKVSLRWVREVIGALPGVLHVRTQVIDCAAGDPMRRRYRLHVTVTEVTPEVRATVHRRIREVLLRVEFPCDILFTEQPDAEFVK